MFKIPASSKLLVIIAVVLALIGIVLATRKGRRLMRTHVLRWLRQSWASLRTLARSPIKLAELFGGSVGVTLAYIASLFARYWPSTATSSPRSARCTSAHRSSPPPTPGGLGAMEAALVAGLTGLGMDSGTGGPQCSATDCSRTGCRSCPVGSASIRSSGTTSSDLI